MITSCTLVSDLLLQPGHTLSCMDVDVMHVHERLPQANEEKLRLETKQRAARKAAERGEPIRPRWFTPVEGARSLPHANLPIRLVSCSFDRLMHGDVHSEDRMGRSHAVCANCPACTNSGCRSWNAARSGVVHAGSRGLNMKKQIKWCMCAVARRRGGGSRAGLQVLRRLLRGTRGGRLVRCARHLWHRQPQRRTGHACQIDAGLALRPAKEVLVCRLQSQFGMS